MKEIIAPLEGIDAVVVYLKELLPEHAIIFLQGDLASGKTTLTQAISRSCGIDSAVTSPTFALQQCYGEGLYHYDLYRIEHSEFMELGLFEEFEKKGWHLIEWASEELRAFLDGAGYECYRVKIDPLGDQRKYTITKGE